MPWEDVPRFVASRQQVTPGSRAHLVGQTKPATVALMRMHSLYSSDNPDDQRPRKVSWVALLAALALNLFVLYALARFLVPDLADSVVKQAERAFSVTVSVHEPEPPEDAPSIAPPQPDPGAAGEAGAEALAREVSAPRNPLPRPSPAPRAASTGTANQSGALRDGDGTGAGGQGDGTGSGRSGQGRVGEAVSGPSVRSGRIDTARDFPIPEGGRAVRYGTSVTVHFTVTPDGRATNCSVSRPGPDAATNALVCPLVIERIRFNPALDAGGNTVPARYGWRQDFFRP